MAWMGMLGLPGFLRKELGGLLVDVSLVVGCRGVGTGEYAQGRNHHRQWRS